MIAPARRSRSTATASARAILSFIVNDPLRVGRPATSIKSLIDTRTRWRGPCASLRITAISAARAARRAPSASTATKAFSADCVASRRANAASMTPTGDTWRRAIRDAISVASSRLSSLSLASRCLPVQRRTFGPPSLLRVSRRRRDPRISKMIYGPGPSRPP
jgi:hypothetical protein